MVDDFWGESMKTHFLSEMEKVFPDRKPVSLELSHPIFNAVFPLTLKPQVPGEDSAERNKGRGVYETWEDEIRYEDQLLPITLPIWMMKIALWPCYVITRT